MSDVRTPDQSPDPPIEQAHASGLDVDAVFPEPSGWRDWSLRTVFGRTLADRLAPALVSGITLFLLAVWMGPLYTSLEDSLADLTESFGDGFVSIFGDFATPAGWLNAELYSLMAPAVVIYIAVSSAASAFADGRRSIRIDASNSSESRPRRSQMADVSEKAMSSGSVRSGSTRTTEPIQGSGEPGR